jgi:serine protease Do
MVDLVARVIPTVVNITAHRVLMAPDDSANAAVFPHIREAVGSGFIVDPLGYIATNRHVIDGAYEIAVTFSDGRTVDARLVFESTVVDMAFLKVDLDRPLPAVTLAANQKIEIGSRVIAVGNPLGLGTSVSAGIVSALDRNIKESPYDDFIQTDAAINHGSSGGPLFNEDGEVIGINTALFSSVDNGGSQGLGFAIPGRDIAFLIDQLKRYKRIRVGWFGARTQKLTPDMAEALTYPGVFGAIVATVTQGSPAGLAGLRPGDVIETVGNQPVLDTTTIERAAALSLGKTLPLRVWRDGVELAMTAEIVEAQDHGSLLPHDGAAKGPRFASAADMGLRLTAIDEAARVRFGLSPEVQGLLVSGVSSGSAADEAGLRTGDVIVSAQMTAVSGLAGLQALIDAQAKKGHHRIIVLLQAQGGQRWVALPLRQ